MKLSDFNYHLPKNLIAQKPARPRDHSRLLIFNKANGHIEHKRFYDIIDYLHKGDVLVLNNSKVMPARLVGKKAATGGKIEVFLVASLPASLLIRREEKGVRWNCLLGGHGGKEGLKVEFGKGLKCEVIKNNHDGTWLVKFNKPYKKMMKIVEKIGQVPLPPYVKREKRCPIPYRVSDTLASDKNNYQTVYADKNKIGSVAAPTAGFHFTPALIKKVKNKGAQIEFITLHVGLGTFAPVKVSDIREHKMHAEWVEIKKETAARIIKAKREKRRIVAVGTTSARALEGCLAKDLKHSLNKIANRKSSIANFIYPGYKFKIIDALITNFHLPKSTLLMLVSAFIYDGDGKNKNAPFKSGVRGIKKIYQEAIKKKYRFYSYGNAMFIK